MIVHLKGHKTASVRYYCRNKHSSIKYRTPLHNFPKHRIQRVYKQSEKGTRNRYILLGEYRHKAVSEMLKDDMFSTPNKQHIITNDANLPKSLSTVHKFLIVLCVSLVACVLWLGMEIKNEYLSPKLHWNEETVVEYGNTEFSCYKIKNAEPISIKPLNVFCLGKQIVRVEYEKDGKIIQEKKTFTVVDTTFPKISLKEDILTTELGEQPNYEDLGIECIDPIDGQTSFQIKKIDPNILGEQKGEIVAEDIHGNKTRKSFTLYVYGIGDDKTLTSYHEKCKELKKEYEERKKREKEEEERKALIEILNVEHLSETTLKWVLEVHKINKEIWDTQYDALVLSVIETESDGVSCDLMQSNESYGGKPSGNSCGIYKDEKEALRGGIKMLRNMMREANVKNASDYDAIAYGLQGYNFGPRWFEEFDTYTRKNSELFSKMMREELNTDVYGLVGYPERVFKFYDPFYEFKEPIEEEKPSTPSEPSEEDEDENALPPTEEIVPSEDKPSIDSPQNNPNESQDAEDNKDVISQLFAINSVNSKERCKNDKKYYQKM